MTHPLQIHVGNVNTVILFGYLDVKEQPIILYLLIPLTKTQMNKSSGQRSDSTIWGYYTCTSVSTIFHFYYGYGHWFVLVVDKRWEKCFKVQIAKGIRRIDRIEGGI